MSKPKSFDSWTPEKQEEWLKRRCAAACKWQSENKDKKKAYDKKRYESKKEEIIEKNARWAKNNPDKKAIIHRRWDEKNREKKNTLAKIRYRLNLEENRRRSRESARKARVNNPEKARARCKKWRDENPEKSKEKTRKTHQKRKNQQAADNFFLMAGAVEEINQAMTNDNHDTDKQD